MPNLLNDRPHHECGVFGIYGHPDVAALTALGLHALQHRGQEAAGIVTFDNKHFHAERRMGLVSDTFTKTSVLGRLKGHSAIGHVRYSTVGKSELENAQPLKVKDLCVAHNGTIANVEELSNLVETVFTIFSNKFRP